MEKLSSSTQGPCLEHCYQVSNLKLLIAIVVGIAICYLVLNRKKFNFTSA